jgi:plasmid stability protein
MKNITVSVPDEVYRKVRIHAAEQDTSLSRLVRDFLTRLGGEETEFERLARQERELRAQIANFSGADRLSREELHDRSLGRQKD